MTEPPPPAAPGRRAGTLGAASALVAVTVVVLGGWLVYSRRDEVLPALASIGWPRTAGALMLTIAGVVATGECWRVLLGAARLPVATVHRVFYVTQAGKYLPGSLWPLVAQATLAQRYGVGRVAVLTASTLFLLLHTVTGVVVGVLGVGVVASQQWAYLLYPSAVVGVVLLLPPVLSRLLSVVARMRPGTLVTAPSWRTTAAATLLMLAAWACYGAATWVLLLGLGAAGHAIPLALGAYALAWVVGFLAFVAPAGVGAREAVLVALLSPVVGLAGALSVALISRVALTVADLGLAGASAGVLRKGVVGGRQA